MTSIPSLHDVRVELARRGHADFMEFTWRKTDPFIRGIHTEAVCSAIDRAIEKYREGESSYFLVEFPFRHGKSDIISRYLPPNFIGKFPDDEIIMTTYGANLSYSFSKFARLIMSSREYHDVYPQSMLAKDDRSVEEWGIEAHLGKIYWTGISGSVIGKGASLLIVDDFCKNREEAESELKREKTHESFTNNLMTRLAPVHIVFILATPWHTDDLIGRIKAHMKEEPNFPPFVEMKFPAMDSSYPSGYLFPERYSETWYKTQVAVLGSYGTASLLQCEPQPRHGGMIRTDKVQIVEELPKDILYVRAYDLASSMKQTAKSDPDFTVGIKLAVRYKPTAITNLTIPIIYIEDIVRGQWEATKRRKTILSVAAADGAKVPIGIEAFGGYKDAYTELRDILVGICGVSKMQLPGDKVAKASPLEPIFEAGNVYLKKAPWNETFLDECKKFPSGKHDDQVDALACAFSMTKRTITSTRSTILGG